MLGGGCVAVGVTASQRFLRNLLSTRSGIVVSVKASELLFAVPAVETVYHLRQLQFFRESRNCGVGVGQGKSALNSLLA